MPYVDRDIQLAKESVKVTRLVDYPVDLRFNSGGHNAMLDGFCDLWALTSLKPITDFKTGLQDRTRKSREIRIQSVESNSYTGLDK